MMTPAQALLWTLLVCGAGAVLTWLVARRRSLAGWIAFAATAVSSALACYAAAAVLVSGPAEAGPYLPLPPLGFSLRVYVDGLSAVFLVLIATIALPAALFSIRYLDHYREYGVHRYYPNFLLFLAAMYGLVSTTDMMWFFFIFWQLMTLPGYALIRFEYRNPANLRAARKYLLMMQIACVLTLIGAELLAGSAKGTSLKYDFDSIRDNLPALLHSRPGLVALAFTLFLIGFGIKLGMWPFGQIWLPDAHPAAPSPVSALLSGVMIKTGVYGLLRCFLWLVPLEGRADFPAARWGWVIAVLGTITLFTGTVQALQQEQTKRLLAFHSIGQAGYILLGTGICLSLLNSPPLIGVALIGFVGALFHTYNHALFKSLLFLNSGTVLVATGTQDLNRLGGLFKFMPLTATTALVASLAISGVPLLNGFASKWCLGVAAIQGAPAARFLPVCGLIALLTSALTLASFIKFFGASFLSRASALVEAKAAGSASLEPPWSMRLPQVFLAAMCLLLGLVPALAVTSLELALQRSRQGLGAWLATASASAIEPGGNLLLLEGRAGFAPLAILAVMVLAFILALTLAQLGGAKRRRTEPWLCGYDLPADHHRYAAHHFYVDLKRYVGWVGGIVADQRSISAPPASPATSTRPTNAP